MAACISVDVMERNSLVSGLMRRPGFQGVRRGKVVHTPFGAARVPCPLD